MTDWLTLLEDHWAWLVLAALLGIGEVLIPGVFLIWIAIAAAIIVLAIVAVTINRVHTRGVRGVTHGRRGTGPIDLPSSRA